MGDERYTEESRRIKLDYLLSKIREKEDKAAMHRAIRREREDKAAKHRAIQRHLEDKSARARAAERAAAPPVLYEVVRHADPDATIFIPEVITDTSNDAEGQVDPVTTTK
jgi:hypothetical protein